MPVKAITNSGSKHMKVFIFHQYKALRNNFMGTFAHWQNHRAIWLTGASVALFLEIFSWAFFQKYLRLSPCEMCVYIRFSMIAICLGGLIGAIKPANPACKLIGYAVVIWGIARGLMWNIRLEMENIRSADPDWVSVCRPTSAEYPFKIPLDKWLPDHFRPAALCGHDSAETFFGLNMAEWLFFVYAAFALMIGLMLFSWLAATLAARKTAYCGSLKNGM